MILTMTPGDRALPVTVKFLYTCAFKPEHTTARAVFIPVCTVARTYLVMQNYNTVAACGKPEFVPAMPSR